MQNNFENIKNRFVIYIQFFSTFFIILLSKSITVLADVQGTLSDVEKGLGSEFRSYANVGIGIVFLIYGACRFFGIELAQRAKRFAFGALAGAIVIVNFEWLRDTLWSWIGG